MAIGNDNPRVQQDHNAEAGHAAAPVQRAPTPFELYAQMRHAAPRPSPYEALEAAGPPV